MYTYTLTKCNDIFKFLISLKINSVKTFLAVPPKLVYFLSLVFVTVNRKSSWRKTFPRMIDLYILSIHFFSKIYNKIHLFKPYDPLKQGLHSTPTTVYIRRPLIWGSFCGCSSTLVSLLAAENHSNVGHWYTSQYLDRPIYEKWTWNLIYEFPSFIEDIFMKECATVISGKYHWPIVRQTSDRTRI